MSYYFWLGAEAENIEERTPSILDYMVEPGIIRTLSEHYGHDD